MASSTVPLVLWIGTCLALMIFGDWYTSKVHKIERVYGRDNPKNTCRKIFAFFYLFFFAFILWAAGIFFASMMFEIGCFSYFAFGVFILHARLEPLAYRSKNLSQVQISANLPKVY